MKFKSLFREPAEVEMHLDGGYTRVRLVRTEGQGLADGGISWDIPTARIPIELRGIGVRFLLVAPHFVPEAHDSADDIRRALTEIEIHPLL